MRIPWLFLLCLLTLTVLFFGPVLVGNEQFAFRDGAHFYFPLFRFIQEEWSHGRIPLWNPYENIGQPLWANPCASVLYPGKLLFLLPFDYTLLYHLYAVLHVLCAGMTMYRLARHWKGSVEGSCFAAISYSFGGCVLYQHLNVIFLVGAAWLPEAVRWADIAFQNEDRENTGNARGGYGRTFFFSRSGSAAVLSGLIFAMMILGGDVQAVYNGLMFVGILGLFGWRSTKNEPNRCWSAFKVLSLVTLTTFLIGAVQILPSWEWGRLSDRGTHDVPQSIWDISGSQKWKDIHDGLLCRKLGESSHLRTTYHFSVSPWRLAEYVFPNFSGRQFPINSRWLHLPVWDDYVWAPSLYCGLIPFLLALSALCFGLNFRKKQRTGTDHDDSSYGSYTLIQTRRLRVVLSWVLLFSVVASFGLFGIGWLLNRIWSETSGIGNPVGGLYWTMNLLLPGYANFRYPAKMLTFAALPLAVLTAMGWDIFQQKINERKTRPSKRGLFSVTQCIDGHTTGMETLGLVVLGMTVFLLFLTPFWMFQAQDCLLFGPFDAELARFGLYRSLGQVLLVLLLAWLFRHYRKWLLVIVLVDIFLANHWLIPTTSRCHFERQPPLLSSLKTDWDMTPPIRIYREPIWYPETFVKEKSRNRLAESVRFDREALFPGYTLENRLAVVNVAGTAIHAKYRSRLKEIQTVRETGNGAEWAKRLAELGVEYLVIPAKTEPDSDHFDCEYRDKEQDYSLWKLKKPGWRAWSQTSQTPCPITTYNPGHIVLEVELEEPETVILAEQFWPGWKATIQQVGKKPETVGIFEVDSIFQGINAPSGQSRITFHYVPKLFYIGLTLSVLGLIGSGIVLYCNR